MKKILSAALMLLSIVSACGKIERTPVPLASGSFHACGINPGGGVKCWGKNLSGQLGDNRASGDSSPIPVEVAGIVEGAVAVAAGDRHSCALMKNGSVKCWGANDFGQLGDETQTSRSTPVVVSGLRGAASIGAGMNHSCALTKGGAVKCWGDNSRGQLGNGGGAPQLKPVYVSGLKNGVKALSVGYSHNCVITDQGELKCWGNNTYGQLASGVNEDSLTPSPVEGLSAKAVYAAAGMSGTCAILDDASTKCWGYNMSSQLGDGTANTSRIPVQVKEKSNDFSSIVWGWKHVCGLTKAGGVRCWGNNDNSQLGDTDIYDRNAPYDVPGFDKGNKAAACGKGQTCVLMESGEIQCWGLNSFGQLGAGKACGSEICKKPMRVLF